MDNLIKPSFTVLVSVLPKTKICLEHLEHNAN